MSSIINVGIIGFGVSARIFHAPFLINNPGYHWSAVVERTTNNAQAFHPPVKTLRNADELFSDPSVDLVVITTPNESHFPFAKKAMMAGKHVVVEKPFTISTDDARQLADIATSKNVKLSVYHNRRYVSDFITCKEILDKELLGEPVAFETYYDRYRPEKKPNAWREENKPGSGILYDLGSHLVDQALYLFGKPQSVFAIIRTQRPDIQTDDYFDIHLDYGILQVRLKAGMLVREMGPRYMIHGRKGSFIKTGSDTQEEQLKNGMMPDEKGFGEEPEEIWGLLHTEIGNNITRYQYPSKKGNFGKYYDDLYEAIIHDNPLPVTPQQAHNCIRIIELALESNRKHCMVDCNGFM